MCDDIVCVRARKVVVLCGLLALFGVLTIATAGCFGGGGAAAPKGSVVGYVSEIDMSTPILTEVTFFASSPGVAGAQAMLVGTGKIAEASSVGKFSFSSVSPGTYDLVVQKPGWPSTKVYGVKVEANHTSELSLRMARPVGGPPTEVVVPDVALDCPATVSGTVNVTVTPSDGSGIYGVVLFVDERPERFWGFGGGPVESGQPLVWEWKTLTVINGKVEWGWDNGEHKLTAMVLDMHYNVAYRTVTVTVANPTEPGSLPATPSGLRCIMNTIHYSWLSFPWDVRRGFGGGPLGLASAVRKVRAFTADSGLQERGTPSGSDALIAADIDWLYEGPDVMGFKVYRNGRFIGDLLKSQGPGWMDGSPVLSPGQRVEYAVSAYNRAGEGPRSSAVSRTPLAPLTPVSLTSPSDGATTNTTPVFQWERVSGAEAYLVFVSSASNTNDLMWVGYTRGADTTSVTYGAAANTLSGAPATPLVSGASYKWGVMAASLQPDLPASDPLDLTGYEPEAWSVSASPVRGFTVE